MFLRQIDAAMPELQRQLIRRHRRKENKESVKLQKLDIRRIQNYLKST